MIFFYSKRQKYLPFAINPPGALNVQWTFVQRRPERSGDAHEFEAEKCRLSGANSAQGTSKTKIVLSFPIIFKQTPLQMGFFHQYSAYTLLSAFSCLTSSRESPEILTISSKAYLPAANIRSAASFIPSFNV